MRPIAPFLDRTHWDEASRLFNRIKIEAEAAPRPTLLPGATRAVPMAAVVDGVLSLISTDAKRDRTVLRSERFLIRKKRSDLPADSSPLRRWYIACADHELYELIRAAVAAFDQTLWQQATERSMLTRSVGLRALFQFVADLLPKTDVPPEAPVRENLPRLVAMVEDRLVEALRRVDDIDFTHTFFEPTGRGQTRIRNVLKVRNGLARLEDLPIADRDAYKVILRS